MMERFNIAAENAWTLWWDLHVLKKSAKQVYRFLFQSLMEMEKSRFFENPSNPLQHSSPAKGGIRFATRRAIDEVEIWRMDLTWKCAV